MFHRQAKHRAPDSATPIFVSRVMHRFGSSWFWFSVEILIILGLLAAGVIWYVAGHRSKQQVQTDQSNPYVQHVHTLQTQPLPKDPMDQAIYYSQIAENYETLHDDSHALVYYLKAQGVIDQHHLGDSLAFYRTIAELYAKQKDKANAKLYFQKEIQRLHAYQADHPEDTTASDVIKAVQQELNSL